LDYSQKYQFSKFAHFIWNKTAGSFSHLDIAVIVYDKKDFNIRFRSEFPEKSVVSGVDKVKLVRADGDIPLSTVQGLIGDFFRYNELVQEFFEGK